MCADVEDGVGCGEFFESVGVAGDDFGDDADVGGVVTDVEGDVAHCEFGDFS